MFILTASFREQESNKVEKVWWSIVAYTVVVRKQREIEREREGEGVLGEGEGGESEHTCFMGSLLLYLFF